MVLFQSLLMFWSAVSVAEQPLKKASAAMPAKIWNLVFSLIIIFIENYLRNFSTMLPTEGAIFVYWRDGLDLSIVLHGGRENRCKCVGIANRFSREHSSTLA